MIAATEAMGNGKVTEVLHCYHGEVTENASLLLVKYEDCCKFATDKARVTSL